MRLPLFVLLGLFGLAAAPPQGKEPDQLEFSLSYQDPGSLYDELTNVKVEAGSAPGLPRTAKGPGPAPTDCLEFE